MHASKLWPAAWTPMGRALGPLWTWTPSWSSCGTGSPPVSWMGGSPHLPPPLGSFSYDLTSCLLTAASTLWAQGPPVVGRRLRREKVKRWGWGRGERVRTKCFGWGGEGGLGGRNKRGWKEKKGDVGGLTEAPPHPFSNPSPAPPAFPSGLKRLPSGLTFLPTVLALT